MTDEIFDSQGTGTLNRAVNSVFQLEANLPRFLLVAAVRLFVRGGRRRPPQANRQQLKIYWRDRLETM